MDPDSTSAYDLKTVVLPRLAGTPLRLFVSLLEKPIVGPLLMSNLLQQSGVTRLRKLKVAEPPTFCPSLPAPEGMPEPPADSARFLESDRPGPRGFSFPGIRDFVHAYRSGVTTPVQVAERALAAIEASDRGQPPLRAFVEVQPQDVLAQAEASARRHREGRPIGPLDGVPVAVKDEVDMAGYHTRAGTSFLGESPAARDATTVARLRASGAILLGKANMHEIGIGVTGCNPHHGTPRNPYNPAHYTGGSSSGPAAAVAAGFCPVALGADGGGSIRMPSSFCGLVGLKPTFGRVSEFGAAPLDWSVAHLGPIAFRAEDAALVYSVLAGPDPLDPHSLRQPAATLRDFDGLDLHGVTLGVFGPWFNHASPAMVEGCRGLLECFKDAGAEVQEVTIPELDAARIAHLVTISSEMAAAMADYHPEHWRDHSLEVRIDLKLASAFTSQDYVRAQRVRTRTTAIFERALRQVDAIVTPGTGITAPPVPNDALLLGESDLTTLLAIMRFATPPNLTGHPAIVFPAGYDEHGLPIGFQAIGRAWEEQTLLRLAHVAEQAVERKEPQLRFRVL